MPNSDPEGQSFLSTPNSHGRFFSLHTLSVFIAFCHFKYETCTNILTETLSLFCSCGYNIINLVQRLQLHVDIIGRVPAPIAQLVECPLRGTGGHGFDPGPRHTKVVKH